jgi:hypothetical protein
VIFRIFSSELSKISIQGALLDEICHEFTVFQMKMGQTVEIVRTEQDRAGEPIALIQSKKNPG